MLSSSFVFPRQWRPWSVYLFSVHIQGFRPFLCPLIGIPNLFGCPFSWVHFIYFACLQALKPMLYEPYNYSYTWELFLWGGCIDLQKLAKSRLNCFANGVQTEFWSENDRRIRKVHAVFAQYAPDIHPITHNQHRKRPQPLYQRLSPFVPKNAVFDTNIRFLGKGCNYKEEVALL